MRIKRISKNSENVEGIKKNEMKVFLKNSKNPKNLKGILSIQKQTSKMCSSESPEQIREIICVVLQWSENLEGI